MVINPNNHKNPDYPNNPTHGGCRASTVNRSLNTRDAHSGYAPNIRKTNKCKQCTGEGQECFPHAGLSSCCRLKTRQPSVPAMSDSRLAGVILSDWAHEPFSFMGRKPKRTLPLPFFVPVLMARAKNKPGYSRKNVFTEGLLDRGSTPLISTKKESRRMFAGFLFLRHCSP